MKKIASALVFVLLMTSAFASLDSECQDNGFDFGIAKYEYDEEMGFFLSEEGELPGYETNVNGTEDVAYWTSVPDAAGVLSKEGLDYQVLPGGSEGTITKGEFGISHVTFCGTTPSIPEYDAVSAVLGLTLVAGLFVFMRKR